MHETLWEYAVTLYAQPDVEEACLALQAVDADVCLLLCAAWLAQRGVDPNASRSEALQRVAQPWRTAVVQPLRALRQQWRQAALEDTELRELRQQIKQLELASERVLLERLEACTAPWPTSKAQSPDAWLSAVGPLGEPATAALAQLANAAHGLQAGLADA